jgi:DNA repair protein RadD
MITLRPDQSELVDACGRAIKQHQSVLMQAPTGFGKSIVHSRIALGAMNKQRRVVLGVHRRELAYQMARTFDRFGIRYGFITASMMADPFATVQIASANTLANRRHWLKCDLFLPDECHLWASSTRAEMILEARGHGAKILGATATPRRLDGKPLSGLFDCMVDGPNVRTLIDAGHLSDYRAFAPVAPDMSGLHIRGGDYVTGELSEKFDKPSVVGDAITHYRKFAAGKRCLAFAFSRQHGTHLCETYNANGIPAQYIDGSHTHEQRRAAISEFAEGRALVLVNVGLCTEGFDLSSQVGREVPIEAVSLQRPTASTALALQMVGRALRRKSEPAVIMDHVNLLAQHGLPDDNREWSLDGAEVVKRKPGKPSESVMICGSCFFTARPFLRCPHCGAVREVSGREVKQVDGALEEIDREAVRRLQAFENRRAQGMAKDLPSLARLAVEQGKHPGWIRHVLKARGARVPNWNEVQAAMEAVRR